MSLNIPDFSLFFIENCNTLWKRSPPFFPATPLQKLRFCQTPFFENLVGGSTPHPPSRKGGCSAHYVIVATGQDSFSNTKPHMFRIPKNQGIPNTPLTCLNFSFSIKGLSKLNCLHRKKLINSSIVDYFRNYNFRFKIVRQGT